MKKTFLFALAIMFCTTSFAQQKWTLQECIEYALQNNITLKQKENTCKQSELQLSTARNSRLPDLNAGVAENVSFGRGLTANNTYSNTNTTNSSFYLQTSVPLLTGNRIPNQIKLQQLNLEALTADLQKAKNDISVQIAQQYLQVVYDMEIAHTAQEQVSIDSMQCVRLEEFVKVGKASAVQLSQQKASLAQSKLTATQADNQYHLDLLGLTQMLELSTPDGFEIVRPQQTEVSINLQGLNPDAIYAEAVSFKPEIQAEQLRLSATDKSIKIAKSALYPTLSLSAGLSSNFYTSSKFETEQFIDQIKNNFSQSISLNLSVPIFNRMSTRNSIKSAKIDKQNQQLMLDNTKKALYKEIQQAYYNAVASQAKYESSKQAEQSSKDAFELMQAKYENGKANITEFNEAKNALIKAESDMIQARYQMMYQAALIGFYRNGQLEIKQ